MRRLLILLLVIVAATAFAQPVKKRPVFRTVKTIFIDLNNDNITDTIILSSSLPEKTSFNRISILMSGVKRKTFIAKESWTIVDKWFLDSNKNTVNTNLLFLKKTDKHTVIYCLVYCMVQGTEANFR